MNRKHVAVVTEAGNGLGKKFAKILKDNDYNVVLAACRESYEKLSKDGEGLRDYELIEVDFTSEESLATFEKLSANRMENWTC